MARVCFTLRVDPARLDEYRARHAEVWPEMLAALHDAGWRDYTLRHPMTRARLRGAAIGAVLLGLFAANVVTTPAAIATQTTAVGAPSPAADREDLPEAVTGGAFAEPPADTLPGFRWWWTTPYDQTSFPREVDALADAGFGVAEAGYQDAGFATPEQRQALAATIDAAKRRNLRLDLTMGPAWPLRNEAVSNETGLSQLELDYGREDLVGPQTYTGPAPEVRPAPPCPAVSNTFACAQQASGGKLVAVTAAKVVSNGTPLAQPPTQSNADATTEPVQDPTVLDPASLVDLTDRLDGSGNLTWEVPAGQWILFGFYERPTAQEVVDHLRADSSRALVGFLDEHVLAESADDLRAVGGDFFEDSVELNASLLWTPAMPGEFRERQGYDLTKYLPVLFVPGFYTVPVPAATPPAEFDLPGDLGARVRKDFWRTLDDLYVSEHIGELQAWAETHDMRYRAQVAYAGTFNVIRAAREATELGAAVDHESRNAGDPQPYGDPTWWFAMDNYREMAAGAHQGGSSDVGLELGATNARDYLVGLGEYKAIMDKTWAGGITRPFIHGLVNQPADAAWPGASRFGGLIANSWNPATWPEWDRWPTLSAYWARGNLVLRQGKPQVDVAIYRDAFTTWQASYADLALDVVDDGVSPGLPGDPLHDADGGRPVDNAVGANTPKPFFATRGLEQRGFRLEYIDPDGLTDERAGKGAVLFPYGPSYRALVVDQRSMPAAAARAIAERAEAGLAVVFVGDLPAAGTGAREGEAEDQAVQQAIARALLGPNVARVATQDDVADVLDRLGVQPDAAWSKEVPVYSQHRRTATTDYFYLWNAGGETADFTARLATQGAGRVLDLWSGRQERLGAHRVGDRHVEVPLTLAPGETRVLAFSRDVREAHVVSVDRGEVVGHNGELEVRDDSGGTRRVTFGDGRTEDVRLPDAADPLALERWHLEVAESNPDSDVVKAVDLDGLRDWRDIEELSGSSGTGTYRTTFELPASDVGPRHGAYLELGRVEGPVEVRLNGVLVTPAAIAPDRIDLAGALRPGANELRVTLSTTLKNRLVALAKQGDVRGGAAGLLPATQPYGLLGPARVVPYGRAVVDAEELPDLTATDLRASQAKPKETTLTSTVVNQGGSDVGDVVVEFRDGDTVLGRSGPVTTKANASKDVSFIWDTRGVKGDHVITAVVDPGNVILESDEANNSMARIVTVRGNKVANGSFESTSDGTRPEGWTGGSSGTSYDASGSHASDGQAAVGTTGLGVLTGRPSWTSAPIDVTPGTTYDLAMTMASEGSSSSPGMSVSYLDSTGAVLGTVTGIATTLTRDAPARQVTGRITVPAGVSKVRLTLTGFALTDSAPGGTVWFDDIWMW